MGDFKDTLYTIDKRGNRKWVYPSFNPGRFFQIRSVVVYLLMALYLLMPWIQINGMQGIRFDIPNRKAIIFGSIFWATDTSYLVLVIGSLAIALYFFTAMFGRIWCGWACPETVFLEFLFRPLERLIEGNGAERLRLDKQPWNLKKIFKKALKYLLFLMAAWLLANTFLAYFVGKEQLLEMMRTSPTENISPFLVTVAIIVALLFQFGWFREQFCTIVCPYARFQSVLLDSNSLVVGYDAIRGEPRGTGKKGKTSDKFGDCVDCGLCVKVCPTGIDIRNGLQLECINCAACIDACDSIMSKLGREKGLIRYDTENGFLRNKTKLLRPRVVIYSAILFAYALIFAWRLSNRVFLDVNIVRGSADVAYSSLSAGIISNHLHARLENKSLESHQISFTLNSNEGVFLITPINPYPLAPQARATTPIFINFPTSLLVNGRKEIEIHVSGDDGYKEIIKVILIGPGA